MSCCTRYALPCLLLLALVLPACQSGDADTTGQRSDGFPAPDREMVYEAAIKAIVESGFTPDYDQSSERTGVLTSRYQTQLAPFSGTGTRDRVTVTITSVPKHENYFRVETNVTREQNVNVKNPSDPVFAEWENGTRQTEAENLITRRIEMAFLPGAASSDWRRGQGLDPRSPRLENLDPPKPKESSGLLGLGPLDLPGFK